MTVSFIHHGNSTWASYRYRAARPAAYLGAALNDESADVVVYSKPMPIDIQTAGEAKADGRMVIADYCDDHFDILPWYRTLLDLADVVTCATPWLARRIHALRADVTPLVIDDPAEFEEAPPHVHGVRMLWFGHQSNLDGLYRVCQTPLHGQSLMIISNAPQCVPWSLDTMRLFFPQSDVVILPATKPWKSPNRAVEAIRQGCFVVAEPHPSLAGIPGIYIGDIHEGIAWTREHHADANERVREGQAYVRERFSLERCGEAWRQAVSVGVPA